MSNKTTELENTTDANGGYGDKLESNMAAYAQMLQAVEAAELELRNNLDEPGAMAAYRTAKELALQAYELATTGVIGTTPEVPVSDVFSIEPLDVLQTGISGSGRCSVRVHGYWSSDSISLYVTRNVSWRPATNPLTGEVEHSAQWEFSITHSSGGRDTKVLEDDLVAEANYGHALIALASYATELRSAAFVTKLEDLFQGERALRKAEREAQRAAQQARIDADPALGESRAKALLDMAIARMKFERTHIAITAYERGSEHASGWSVNESRGGITQVFCAGNLMPRKKALSILATLSERTCIA